MPPPPLKFEVPGAPVPWQRAASFGKQRFTAPKTRAYQALVCAHARRAMLLAGASAPWDGPCILTVTYFVHDMRRRDNSNLLKSVEDACNGVIWADDSWIVGHGPSMRYLDKRRPRVEALVEFLDEWDAWKRHPSR